MTRKQWSDKAFRAKYERKRMRTLARERKVQAGVVRSFGVFAEPIGGYKHNGAWRHL